jgi:hypothetical protein
MISAPSQGKHRVIRRLRPHVIANAAKQSTARRPGSKKISFVSHARPQRELPPRPAGPRPFPDIGRQLALFVQLGPTGGTGSRAGAPAGLPYPELALFCQDSLRSLSVITPFQQSAYRPYRPGQIGFVSHLWPPRDPTFRAAGPNWVRFASFACRDPALPRRGPVE